MFHFHKNAIQEAQQDKLQQETQQIDPQFTEAKIQKDTGLKLFTDADFSVDNEKFQIQKKFCVQTRMVRWLVLCQ